MKETQSAGGVVLNKVDEILVVNQFGRSWSLPKGHIETGEDAVTAARREIYEEAGIHDLMYIGELGRYQRFRLDEFNGEDKSELKTITIFLFKTKTVALNPMDPENPEARWVRKENVAQLLTHEADKAFFRSIQDRF